MEISQQELQNFLTPRILKVDELQHLVDTQENCPWILQLWNDAMKGKPVCVLQESNTLSVGIKTMLMRVDPAIDGMNIKGFMYLSQMVIKIIEGEDKVSIEMS